MCEIIIIYKSYTVHFKKEKKINSGNPYLEGNRESHSLWDLPVSEKTCNNFYGE